MRFAVHVRDLVQHSAGIRMVHKFARLLVERGEEVDVVTPCTFENWRPKPRQIHLYCDDEDKTVPLSAFAVRWILGYVKNAPRPWELTFTTDVNRFPKLPRLFVPVIDRTLFTPYYGPREGVVFYNGKGPTWHLTGKTVEIDPPDPLWRHMTRHVPATHAEVAQWLQEAEVLVCNDGYTSLTMESLLCGTPVFLMGDQISPPTFKELGVFHKWEDFDEAKEATELAPDVYHAEEALTPSLITQFLNLCKQQWPLA